MRRVSRAVRIVASVVLVLSVSTACSESTDVSTSQSPPNGLSSSGERRGELESYERIFPTSPRELVDAGVRVHRVTYRSTGLGGSETSVTGIVAVPQGDAPEGGWPIIAFGHGTTGIGEDCAPSQDATLYGLGNNLLALTSLGFAVAAPDYQGLGSPGPHPYLEPNTVGYNMIDAVRAARNLIPDTSDRWGVFGASQGGQAGWSASQLASTYGAGSTLVGSAVLAPVADLTPFGTGARTGTLTGSQTILMPLLLSGIEAVHPEMNLADYERGAAVEFKSALLTCSGRDQAAKEAALRQLRPADFVPVDAAAADRLDGWLREMSLPTVVDGAPIMVVFGGRDETVVPGSVTTAVDRACALGSTVQAVFQADRPHSVDSSPAIEFLKARFAGAAPENTCGQDIGPSA